MTGISVDTLRAWERRYKVVSPARSPRGRLYSQADVQRFTHLRNAVANGYAIGEVAALPEPDLAALTARPSETPVAVEPGETSGSPSSLGQLIAFVETLDADGLNEELGRMAALMAPAAFVHEVAMPLMRETGERFHAGTMRIAQEHLATECVRSVLGAIVRLNRRTDSQPVIIATTPAGEMHELGILAASVLAGAKGCAVTCLGPNLPADQILYVARQTGAQVVLLGLTSAEPSAASLETVHMVAGGAPPELEIWVGGAGASRILPRPAHILVLEDFEALELQLNRLRPRVPQDRVGGRNL